MCGLSHECKVGKAVKKSIMATHFFNRIKNEKHKLMIISISTENAYKIILLIFMIKPHSQLGMQGSPSTW